jgi:hypothetical protein
MNPITYRPLFGTSYRRSPSKTFFVQNLIPHAEIWGGYQGNTGNQAELETDKPLTAKVPITYGKPMIKQYRNTNEKKANLAAQEVEQEASQSDEEEGEIKDEDPDTESDFKIIKKAFLAQ